MRHLIKQLLSTHHVSAELDIVAENFFSKAVAETRRRLSRRKHNKKITQRILKDTIACHFTQDLLSTDLIDPVAYDLLLKAIQRWRPLAASSENACLYLQNLMLNLLPMVRQKQQLQKIVKDYQQHLKVEIEQNLLSNHPREYRSCVYSSNVWFGAPPLYSSNAVRPFRDNRDPIERFTADFETYSIEPDTALSGAINKYRAVTHLMSTLKTPIKGADRQVNDFRCEFQIQSPILVKDRDSRTIKFVKTVATFLSAGLAIACGIWNVKGKKTSKDIQQVLSASQPPLVEGRRFLCQTL